MSFRAALTSDLNDACATQDGEDFVAQVAMASGQDDVATTRPTRLFDELRQDSGGLRGGVYMMRDLGIECCCVSAPRVASEAPLR